MAVSYLRNHTTVTIFDPRYMSAERAAETRLCAPHSHWGALWIELVFIRREGIPARVSYLRGPWCVGSSASKAPLGQLCNQVCSQLRQRAIPAGRAPESMLSAFGCGGSVAGVRAFIFPWQNAYRREDRAGRRPVRGASRYKHRGGFWLPVLYRG